MADIESDDKDKEEDNAMDILGARFRKLKYYIPRYNL